MADTVKTPYVETDCVLEFEGRKFESGGAVVADKRIVAYLADNGVLTDWHGRKLGSYRIVATWKTPRSCVSHVMHQVEARVDGVTYTGRSCGIGMVYTGKRKAS